ncbi:MAG: CHAT domain-containing protein [Saprospiraceae bacterium]
MKYIFLLFVIMFFGCESEVFETNQVFTSRQLEALQCIEDYGYCDSLVTPLKGETNCLSKLIVALWLFRNEKYIDAAKIFEDIEKAMQKYDIFSKEFQCFAIAKINNLQNQRNYDYQYIDQLLYEIEKRKQESSIFYMKLLVEKSRKLREQNEINRSFCTAYYAYYISKQLKLSNEDLFDVNIALAVNAIREFDDNELPLFFINKSMLPLDDAHPKFRYAKCLHLYCTHYSLSHDDPKVYEDIIIKNKFAPRFNRLINTNFGFMLENTEQAAIYFRKNFKSNRKSCEKSLYDLNYLVSLYSSVGKLDSARLYLDVLLKNCSTLDNSLEYLILRLQYKYEMNLFKISSKKDDLNKSLEFINLTIDCFNESFSSGNLHYADLHQEMLIDFLELFYIFQKEYSLGPYQKEIYSFLENGKKKRLNLAYKRNAWANSALDNDEQVVFENTIKSIDSMELLTNNYRDTILDNTTIYRELYLNYESLSKLFEGKKAVKKSKITNSVIGYEKLKKNLKESQTQVIEFSGGYENYYITYYNPDTFYIQKTEKNPIDSVLNILIKDLKQCNKETTKLNSNSNYLYKRLVEPFIVESYKNVVIIPDQVLNELPFGALVDTENQSFDTKYFISYSHSTEVLNNEVPSFSHPIKVNLFGFSSDHTLTDRSKRIFTELPLGRIEISAIDSLYTKSKVFEGEEFTKSTIFKHLDSDILHFSTHSFSNPDNMLNNYMMVRDSKGKPAKSFAFEIKNRKLNNSLVILSSCNSGSGVYEFGAGTFSLSRDFLAAGAQTVIKSLWAVNEASTAELLINFHENFSKANSASQSLKMAKHSLKQNSQYSHPYYWAGFVLEGNGGLKIESTDK